MTAAEIEQTTMVTLTIDGVEVTVPQGTLVIRAAEQIGVQIPRFCDHPLLDPVGACRQCLVEVPDAGNGRGMPKPQASCTLPVAPGMVVNTQATSPVADKAQQGMMEFLLINHPLDCPVCDKGGECPLQNQAMSNGRGETRFVETKRTFKKPINISDQVLLDRERCVLCARCTRFSTQIAGDPFIALVERGALQQVGIYEKEPFESYFSGNTIQICPVGALTSAAYRFRSRPFDLVSTPSVAEHDAGGAAIRVDHRRGKVMRRMAGNDPEVNEEWISDRDRFAFTSTRLDDRLTRPMVREDGELRPASWPEAFAVAARGLAAAKGRTAVLPGGRLTYEDAYTYSKFARVALGTNNVDFRSRPMSAEETSFLASHVVAGPVVTYTDLERAGSVVLVGLEAEEEAPSMFLRLRKAVRNKSLRVFSVASHTSRGLEKLDGTLVRCAPGDEASTVADLASSAELSLDFGDVILVGERLATSPGALQAVAELATMTGARYAWVPRRAGDRGAVEAGLLPTLLPGGRPVADPAARVDAGADWGVPVPSDPGLDTDGIVEAGVRGRLGALVVGGVEIADLADPAAARSAVENTPFVVSLEVRRSEVTELADVVLPVAPPVERSGSFVNWEGRRRPFATVLQTNALTDTRVLAGIAEGLDASLGYRTSDQAADELAELGVWDGDRAVFDRDSVRQVAPEVPVAGSFRLSTWRMLIDDSRGNDGEPHLLATGRRPVARVSPATAAGLGLEVGADVTVTTDHGKATLPLAIGDDIADDVVWLPTHLPDGGRVHRDLRAAAGSLVRLSGGAQ